MARLACFKTLDRNSLDDIPRDLAPASIVNARGGGAGMPGQVLHVFERHVLIEQIGDHGDAEAVRRE